MSDPTPTPDTAAPTPAGGLTDYVNRVRADHQRLPNGWCSCDRPLCSTRWLLDHIDDLVKAYELKVQDLARETARNAEDWCNCQALPDTDNYPGPWHPKGDAEACVWWEPPAVISDDDPLAGVWADPTGQWTADQADAARATLAAARQRLASRAGSGTAALTDTPKHGDIRSPGRGNDQVYLDGRDADGEPVAPAGWYEIGALHE